MYIHQCPAWPHFVWDAGAIGSFITETQRLENQHLEYVQSLGIDAEEANCVMICEDVVSTSAIEGVALRTESVRAAVARCLKMAVVPTETDAPEPTDREDSGVAGIVKIVCDAMQNFRAPLTTERLFRWHSALFPTGRSDMQPIVAGRWRETAIAVVSGPMGYERTHFVAPEPARVPDEMAAFIGWCESPALQADLLVKSALAHLRFEAIHPFDDGNGRIGRAISDMLLARSGNSPVRYYSLSAQMRRERRDYYAMLEMTQKSRAMDATPWIEWYLGCLQRSFASSKTQLQALGQKTKVWRRLRDATLNDRQSRVLHRFLDNWKGHLTIRKWAMMMKTSDDIARSDIQGLIDLGVLRVASASSENEHYVLNDSL